MQPRTLWVKRDAGEATPARQLFGLANIDTYIPSVFLIGGIFMFIFMDYTNVNTICAIHRRTHVKIEK